MATVELAAHTITEAAAKTAFLILDTESIPDGRLLARVRYAKENLSPEEAIERARAEAREQNRNGSDFIPYTFQLPVALCVIRVGTDFSLQAIKCLDAPLSRPREIVRAFWQGLSCYKAKLVTFNGRGFDLPLLELAAFRYGCSGRDYFYNSRNRFSGHIDLLDWLGNYGACRPAGGLDLLAKLLGIPGKMEMTGEQVYTYYRQGRTQEINDYCMFDTLDTYFVFLRTRVLTGDLSLDQEKDLTERARQWLTTRLPELPALKQYLDNWGEREPWP